MKYYRRASLSIGILLSSIILLTIFPFVKLHGQEKETIAKEQDPILFYIKSEDSIRLATDIYLPPGKGPFPCILMRTPYNKIHGRQVSKPFLERGWAVVAQDCRGKFESNGVYEPFRHERPDGLATLDWIRAQPWCNGKVGGWGGSYGGFTQWAVADRLDVIVPLVTSANMYELVFPEALFSLATLLNWSLPNGSKTFNEVDPEKMKESYYVLPLSTADEATVRQIDFLDEMLAHPHMDSYWGAMNHRAPIGCPVFSVAGWYDIFLMSQIRDFEMLGPSRHPDSRLIIGPYAHGKITIETDFGDAGDLGLMNEKGMDFVSKVLDENEIGEDDKPGSKAYSLFIMNRNEWVESDCWPPAQTSATPFYLHHNGLISRDHNRTQKVFEYSYDPSDPYPSIGGTYLGVGVGPAWQNPNVDRPDQVVFESKVLEKDLVLLGPVDATIYVGTDAPSTDFFVSLQDVRPDGKIINIQEGGGTIYSDPRAGASPKRADISLWATGYQLDKGHRIRVVISSSLFPRYNRNLNSGEDIFFAKTARIARQKIYLGQQYPSHLLLPVFSVEEPNFSLWQLPSKINSIDNSKIMSTKNGRK